MRSRNLKPGFFKNEALAELPPLARILFEGLWCMADREGRVEDRPKRIKAEILPYDNCNVENYLQLLSASGFIHRYGDSPPCIQILKFKLHQNPHKNETASILPAPSDFDTLREDLGPKTEALGLIPSSLIPDSLSTDSTRSRREELSTVFTFWQRTMRREQSDLSPERKRCIEKALVKLSVEQCCEAITGCSLTDWNMGRDPRSTRKYNDLTLILRDAEHWERFIDTAHSQGNGGPPSHKPFQAPTPDDIAALECLADWKE